MIIELFGPPGCGKTTFAHALARRLCGRGFRAKVALSYQASNRSGPFDLGIFYFILRIASAMFSTSKILLSSKGSGNELSISLSMVRLIPPKRRIWRARLWQYILHLSHCWDQAKQSTEIIIFDQGYVQAIGSLAMFNGGSDTVALAKALSLAPEADFAVRLIVPPGVVEARLRHRMEHEPPAERIFEADPNINMRSFGLFEIINNILVESDRKVISIAPLDDQSTFKSISRVEQQVISMLSQADGGPAAKKGAMTSARRR
ncbi:AAA family ATPase (plasmid) [Mesorhizobium sp. AR07]|uniref:AAA family ATPase n=1 Tax=Mesorhizobium sp. AR07 TaxID=2865838 RepID=UPI00215FEF73|nr:AAA family ATPase [Mesorhizobium sp. AR07]UVK49463.1 AAA family ATPase [Mesorhizobium sp. AR07]